MAAWDDFRLTTVRQDLAAMARRTTELLLDRLARPQREPRHVTVPVELVLRASHAAPPHNR
jgi:DNA-binding LacI/PurR family transcriptional regulator